YLRLKLRGFGNDDSPFFKLSNSLYNDLVIWFQAMVDDPEGPYLFAGFDRAHGGLVVGSYDRDLEPTLKFFDRALRAQEGLLLGAGLGSHTAVLAWAQDVARIGKRCDEADRARVAIYLPVSPQDLALVRIYRAVRQDQFG